MSTKIRVLIADDHPIFRKGLRQVIESDPGLEIVAEAENGAAALEQISLTNPDVAVMDVHMPGVGGFDVVRALREQGVEMAVIILTMYQDQEVFDAAMNLGVRGYVLKDSAITDIVGGIKSVAAGQHYITPQLSGYLIERNRRGAEHAAEALGLDRLTPTERRVLRLLADYKTSKEIAAELSIHSRTVDNHRTNICQKLNLHGSHTLLRFALEHKSQLD
jgi:two-component system, NarL family, response regulator DegU